MPWMVFYQQSAIADKGLRPEHLRAARWDTALGAIITQLVMAAVLVATAATIGHASTPGGTPPSLSTVGELSGALTPFLGVGFGRLVFSAGVLGAGMVAAIVLLAVQTVFFGALRLQKTTTEELNSHLSLERALALVQHDIEGLMVPGAVLAGPFQTSPTSAVADDQVGDRISPDFSTSSGKVDGWNPFGDVQAVTYYLAPAIDGAASKRLVRAVTRNLLPAQDTTSDAQILLEGVTQAAFSYFDGNQWTTTWDSTATSTLPSAIKLSIVLSAAFGQAAMDPIEIVMPVLVQTTTSQTQAATGTMP